MRDSKKLRDGGSRVHSPARREAERECKRHRVLAKRLLTKKGYDIPGYVESMRSDFSNPRTSASVLLDNLKFLRWLTDQKLRLGLGYAERGCLSFDFTRLRQRASCLLCEIQGLRDTSERAPVDEWRSLVDPIFHELVSLDREVLHAIESYEVSHEEPL